MYISLIIPVYNRPRETEELLESLCRQTRHDFEVVIVEDGSAAALSSEEVAASYGGRLRLKYIPQENGGPASARNTGATAASGDFFIFMDSDCVVPEDYFEVVYDCLASGGIEFFGGPDKAGEDFTPLQKAVSYSMTSPFTTGGIRGARRRVSEYSPRSFNLGISAGLFRRVGGFGDMRIGEDIDFSKRVSAAGARAYFLPLAAVYHKRRTSMRLFFKQVFIFGVARVNLNIRHSRSRKAVYVLPSLFTLGSVALLVAAVVCRPLFSLPVFAAFALIALGGAVQTAGAVMTLFMFMYAPWWFYVPFGALMALWFADASVRTGSVRIGWLAVWTSFIQLYGYGAGFLYGLWMRRIRHRDEKYTYKVTSFLSSRTR